MSVATYTLDSQMTTTATRTSVLRAELEQTRIAFFALLDRVGEAQWHAQSPSCAWSVGEVCLHLTWALEMLPKEVDAARRGRGMFNLPQGIGAALSYWYTRWLARGVTPSSLRARYDRAMDATLRLLDTIPEGDWARGADFYGEGFHSVEDLFHSPAEHFAEHAQGL